MRREEEWDEHHEEEVVRHGELEDLKLELEELLAVNAGVEDNNQEKDEAHDDSHRHRGHKEYNCPAQVVVFNFSLWHDYTKCQQQEEEWEESGRLNEEELLNIRFLKVLLNLFLKNILFLICHVTPIFQKLLNWL